MPCSVMDAVENAARNAKDASYCLQSLTQAVRNEALQEIAAALQEHADEITRANQADVREAEKAGLPKVLIKRLGYDRSKILESVESLRSLIKQEDPIGKLVSSTELDSGLVLERVTCPIGVIGVIFEARPEALVQISSLCLKSGNAVILKGGSEAHRTNEILAQVIVKAVTDLDERFASAVQLLSTREEINRLAMDQFVDLIIPAAQNQLVRFIRSTPRYWCWGMPMAFAIPTWTSRPTWRWPCGSASTPRSSIPRCATPWRRCWSMRMSP